MKRILAAAMLFLCLTGCQALPESPAFPQQTATLPAETAAGEILPSETPLPAEEWIETADGIALTGRITSAEEGWQLVLTQPVKLRLQYGAEVLEYPALTVVGLFDQWEDGVYKEAYAGRTVTCRGILSCYPDPENIRLFLYSLSVGGGTVNRTEAVHEMAEDWRPSYDPALSPAQTPLTENGVLVWNPLLVSREALETMGNDFAGFYGDFVTALLAGETSCACPHLYYASMLRQVLPYECPVFTADVLVGEKHYDPENHRLYWAYSSTPEEHQALLAAFREKVNGYLSAAGGQGEVDRALALYKRLCSSVAYNWADAGAHDFEEPYYGFRDGAGICTTISAQYHFLLSQGGIACYSVEGRLAEGDGHAWNAVELGGSLYYCDPTFDLATWQTPLYFGMSRTDRLTMGAAWDAGSILVGRYTRLTPEAADIAETGLTLP